MSYVEKGIKIIYYSIIKDLLQYLEKGIFPIYFPPKKIIAAYT